MRHSVLVATLLLSVAACGSSDDDADAPVATEAPADEPPAEPADADTTVPATAAPEEPTDEPVEEPADEPTVPGPGDAVGTLTGPDLDIAVVGQCDYDVSDLTSADIAFADVRGVDPAGVEWPARFGLSGSDSRNTQVNIDGTRVVVRWPEPGLLEQSTDDGSYVLDTTIGRLVVTTADGYELNVSCFER